MTNILQDLLDQIKGLTFQERKPIIKQFILKNKNKHYKKCRYIYYTMYLGNRNKKAEQYRKSKQFKLDNARCLKYLYKDTVCSCCHKPIPYDRYKHRIFKANIEKIKQCSEVCHQKVRSQAGIKAQTPEIRQKAVAKGKQTMLRRYGYTSALACPELRKKAKQTMMQKYGVEHVMQNKDIQAKAIATFKKLMQDPIRKKQIISKQIASRRKNDPTWGTRKKTKSGNSHGGATKKYDILGKCFECQSKTEANFVEWIVLRKGFDINDIIDQFNPEFNSFVYNEIHTFPDFYIKSKNIYIEVKSLHTLFIGIGNTNKTRITFIRNQQKAERSITQNITVRWIIGGNSKKYGPNHYVLLPKNWYDMTYTEVKQYLNKHGLETSTY